MISGGLILWDPLTGHSALLLPLLCWAGLNVVHLIAVAILMKEPTSDADGTGLARAAASTREAPRVIREGLGMLRHNQVLLTLVLVEVFMTTGLVVFEIFQPIRLAELVGGEERAGALMGPVAAIGWGVFALGSALAGFSSARIGVARTAIIARVLNGLGAVTMGVIAGPVALIAAYLFTYGLHGTGGPMHQTLLHREARARNRATVLSMNSMVFFVTFSVVAPPLGLLAESTTTQVAMVTAGTVSMLGALLYLPALRAERERDPVRRSGRASPEPSLRVPARLELRVRSGPLALDLAAEEVGDPPQQGEERTEEEHHRHDEPERHGGDLQHPADAVRRLGAQRPGQHETRGGEAEADGEGGAERHVAESDHHRRGQAEHDRPRAPGRPRTCRGAASAAGPRSGLAAHPRPFSIVRASPTVTTEPVTSTAPEPIEPVAAPPPSARAAAWSIASASRGTTVTRSSP